MRFSLGPRELTESKDSLCYLQKRFTPAKYSPQGVIWSRDTIKTSMISFYPNTPSNSSRRHSPDILDGELY
uniref:Uncharacterized protein n=1 Tax=Solanum tuberosum TaxID=4113 RepID=M1CBU1_SOLTU